MNAYPSIMNDTQPERMAWRLARLGEPRLFEHLAFRGATAGCAPRRGSLSQRGSPSGRAHGAVEARAGNRRAYLLGMPRVSAKRRRLRHVHWTRRRAQLELRRVTHQLLISL